MSEDWNDVERELNTPGMGGYYKPNALPIGGSEEIVVVSHMKWTQTKYPIKDKQGKDLGYTWRFRLADGRVWDVSNANRKVLLRGLHPEGVKLIVPAKFKITNIGKVVDKTPAIKVEYVGAAPHHAPTQTADLGEVDVT